MSAFCSVALVQDVVRDLSSHHQAFINLMSWWHHTGQKWRVTKDKTSLCCILEHVPFQVLFIYRIFRKAYIALRPQTLQCLFVSHPWRSTNTDHITPTQDQSIQRDFIYWWRCVTKKRSRAEVKDTQPFASQCEGRLKGNHRDVVDGQEQTGCDEAAADTASSSEAFAYERHPEIVGYH